MKSLHLHGGASFQTPMCLAPLYCVLNTGRVANVFVSRDDIIARIILFKAYTCNIDFKKYEVEHRELYCFVCSMALLICLRF